MPQKIVSAKDMRKEASRKLPKMVFDFLEGGALDEITLRDNTRDIDRLRLQQRVLCDLRSINLETEILGSNIALPIIVSPMGGLVFCHPEADLAIARAASAAGTIFIHSAWSACSLEEVVALAPHSTWVQIAFWTDAGLTREHVNRAKEAGAEVLVVPGDVGVSSKRERDLHHGAGTPPRPGLREVLNTATKPGWLSRLATGRKITYGNYQVDGRRMRMAEMGQFMHRMENPGATWRDVQALREEWPGKIVVKGVVSPDDVDIAIEVGVDGVLVSNHGGRQFDAQQSTIAALPDVVAAAGGKLDVIIDSGIRRGSDVAKCLALGAKACGIGRPVAYSLAAEGPKGPGHLLEILREELAVALGFTGTTDVREIDGTVLANYRSWRTATGLDAQTTSCAVL
jgi:isopentenyl diphosphate isomerase/L-lactate dehydrogenase-like FMN-dependent dehydrogenase